jgi:hypothetical protein
MLASDREMLPSTLGKSTDRSRPGGPVFHAI